MNNAKVRNTNYAGIVFHMMISLFLILVGTMELYSSLMKPLYYVFIICGFLMVWAVSMVVRYFAKSEFRIASNYDFSIGCTVLLGSIGILFKAETVSIYFIEIVILMIFYLGLVSIQHTVQMKQLGSKLFLLNFLFAAALITFSLITGLQVNDWIPWDSQLLLIGFVVAGGLGILSQILIGLRVSKYNRDEEKNFWKNALEAANFDEVADIPEEYKGKKKKSKKRRMPLESKETDMDTDTIENSDAENVDHSMDESTLESEETSEVVQNDDIADLTEESEEETTK